MEFNALNGTSSCNSNLIFDLSDPVLADQWVATDIERFFVHVFIPVVSAVGVFGNAAFMFMVFRLPELRTSLNAYLVNLAVCDIMFLLFVNFWYALYTSDVDLKLDVKSALGCAFYMITTRVWYLGSVELMTIISVERFYAICKPLQHIMMRGKRRTFKILLAIWFVAVLVALTVVPNNVVFKEACVLWPPMEIYEDLPTIKRLCYPVNIQAEIYDNMMALIDFVGPLIVNIWLYVCIILALQSRPVISASGVDERQKANADRVRNQVARTLILNGVVFFLCQTPYRFHNLHTLLTIMRGYGILGSRYHFIISVGHIFLLMNSVINPFLYVFSCQFYRQSLMKALGFRR